MPSRKKKKNDVENIPQSGYSHPRESLRKRIRKHVSDKKDKITDQDIKSVKVDTVLPSHLEKLKKGEPIPPEQMEDEHPEEKKPGDEPKKTTPWDLIGE